MMATPDQNLRRNEFSKLKLIKNFCMNIVLVPWRTICRVGNSNHQIVLVLNISLLGDRTYQARTIRAQTIKFEIRNTPLCKCPPGALEDEALGRRQQPRPRPTRPHSLDESRPHFTRLRTRDPPLPGRERTDVPAAYELRPRPGGPPIYGAFDPGAAQPGPLRKGDQGELSGRELCTDGQEGAVCG
jgi:hypothetical protein